MEQFEGGPQQAVFKSQSASSFLLRLLRGHGWFLLHCDILRYTKSNDTARLKRSVVSTQQRKVGNQTKHSRGERKI